jgi:hypothetical protein
MNGDSMDILHKINYGFAPRKLTRNRIVLAATVAVMADGLQMLLGPMGWAGADQVIDGVAMILTCWILGFHLLLLPTFFVELFPMVDMLPTWTACVGAVIAMRKNAERKAAPPPIVETDVPKSMPPADDYGTRPR